MECLGYRNAFVSGFSRSKYLEGWSLVGINPSIRKFLKDSKIRHEMGSESGYPLDEQMRSIWDLNKIYVRRINCLGYNGELLSAKLNLSLTIEKTIERISPISKISTHWEKFYVTRGSHAISDDMFKAVK